MSKERAAKIAELPGRLQARRRREVSFRQRRFVAGRHDRPEEGRRPQGCKAIARKS